MTTVVAGNRAPREGSAARRWRGWPAVASILSILAAWAVAAHLMGSIYFPGPWAVVERFIELARGRLPSDMVASLEEAFGGWLIGSVAGIATGMAIGCSRLFAQFVKPLLNFLRHISPLAWVPLAILWFGVGYWSKTSVIVLIAFFNLVVNTAHGVSAIDETILKAARVLHLRRSQRLSVFLMSAVPDVLVGLRFALGLSWGGVVIAELVAGNTGIGALEFYGGQSFDVAQIMVGMVVLALVGILANWLFLLIQRKTFPWLVSDRMNNEAAARLTE